MDTLTAIYERRAVKHFDSEHKIPTEIERNIFEAVLQSPTSFNMQQWRFLLVKDSEKRRALREAALDQAQVTEASLLVVIAADLRAWAKDPSRYWVNAPEEVGKMLVDWMGPFYDGKEELQRDEAMRSCGIAAQTLMLASKALGYDSCPMIGFDAERVAEIISLPKEHVIGMMVAIGKATKPAWPKPGQLSYDEVVFTDRF